MKLSLPLSLAALATVALSTVTPFSPVKAVSFGQEEVEQESFIAVAAPYGDDNHNLLIIEQIPGERECWSESGSNPVVVDPLLLEFDFTGSCNRSTDSNGYSIRIDGTDYGLNYLLRVVERDGELMLIGTPRGDSTQGEVVVGSTNGLADGFLKINLNPEWRFTKRVRDGKPLGHVYLTQGQGLFADIGNDTYKSEIEQAAEVGFVSGFEDDTFRPETPLTREQLVSMVIEALSTIPNANVTVPTQASSQPYPDVEASRWSAAKIEWAKQNDIVTGYPDGQFRPANEVTRAELIAVERQAAEYAKTQMGMPPELTGTEPTITFSDTSNHWGESLISQMSSYCGVASPLNETGDAFAPDTSARRNYAAAATLRMLNCTRAEANGTQEQPSNQQEQPNGVQEQPNDQQEQPSNQQEQPSNQQEQPSNQQEQPSNQQEQPSNQQEQPNGVQEQSSDQQEQPNDENRVVVPTKTQSEQE